MKLIRRKNDSWGLMGLQDRVNDLFESVVRGSEWDTFTRPEWPTVDVVETPETVQVKAEMPGIDPGNIDISVHNDMLTIRGEKKSESEARGKTWHRRERTSGMIARTIQLPVTVDADHVDAVAEAGVLTITLPKAEHTETKRISVRTK